MITAKPRVEMVMKFAYLFIFSTYLLFGCSEQPQPQISTQSTSITPAQAVALVQELPETKAWAKYVEEKTKEKSGATVSVEPQPAQTIGHQTYWPVVF